MRCLNLERFIATCCPLSVSAGVFQEEVLTINDSGQPSRSWYSYHNLAAIVVGVDISIANIRCESISTQLTQCSIFD